LLRGSGEVAPNLLVKEVRVDDRRCVVFMNPGEAQQDAASRKAIPWKLEKTVSQRGAKAVAGNRRYARFLKLRKGGVTVNQEAVEADQRFDGEVVLTTNATLLPPKWLRPKRLWRVERTFRKEKSASEVRPIYHHRDETGIGHIVASFLALRLEVNLQARLDKKGIKTSRPIAVNPIDWYRSKVFTW